MICAVLHNQVQICIIARWLYFDDFSIYIRPNSSCTMCRLQCHFLLQTRLYSTGYSHFIEDFIFFISVVTFSNSTITLWYAHTQKHRDIPTDRQTGAHRQTERHNDIFTSTHIQTDRQRHTHRRHSHTQTQAYTFTNRQTQTQAQAN